MTLDESNLEGVIVQPKLSCPEMADGSGRSLGDPFSALSPLLDHTPVNIEPLDGGKGNQEVGVKSPLSRRLVHRLQVSL